LRLQNVLYLDYTIKKTAVTKATTVFNIF